MNDTKYTILYVDDEESNLRLFKNIFRKEYDVLTALSGKEGLEILRNLPVDLIITDQRMPEMTGVNFLVQAIDINPFPKRFLLTAYADFDSIKGAINEGKIYWYIQKPWDIDELTAIIKQAIKVYHIEKENARLTAELIRINAELEELDTVKNEFLNLLNHELRTPLNGILGGLSLIKEVEIPDEIEQFIFLLDISAKRLEKFSYKALDISTLRAQGRGALDVKEHNLTMILLDIQKELTEIAAKKNITLHVTFTREVLPVKADKNKIRNTISYVVDNAIKFSDPDSTIQVIASEEENQVSCTVKDQGPGFSEYAMKNLFKPFSNVKSHIDANIGVSLYYAKLVMDAHGGLITVEKNEPMGSVVRLIIPRIS
jgi:signal transduction histidine kinase